MANHVTTLVDRARRRGLHGPSQCRAGCGACVGALLRAGGFGPRLRRAMIGTGAAAAVAASFVLVSAAGESPGWRDRALDLASHLAQTQQGAGSPAVELATDLRNLGYASVPELPTSQERLPGGGPEPDDSPEANLGGEGDSEPGDGEPGDGELGDDGDAADVDVDDANTDVSGNQDRPGDRDETAARDGEDGGGESSSVGSGPDTGGEATARDSGERGESWEEVARELAELLEGVEDPAGEDLARALTDAGFGPGSEEHDEQERGGDAGADRLDGDGRSGGESDSVGSGEVLWDADVETGDLSQFEGGGDDPQQVGAPEPEIVDGRDGNHAVSFTIPGGGNRNEVLPDAEFSDGDERWFGFSSLLEDGFPVDAAWQVIVQWKNDGTGSPPLSLNVENGEYLLHGGYSVGKEWTESIGPATAGEWVDWVVHVEFAGGAGRVDVWQDGEQVVDGLVPDGGTLYPGKDSYLKIGYYRDTGIGEDGTVVFDNWKMGTSYDAVAPGGSPAGGTDEGPESSTGSGTDAGSGSTDPRSESDEDDRAVENDSVEPFVRAGMPS